MLASNDSHDAKKMRMEHSAATNVNSALRPTAASLVVLMMSCVSVMVISESVRTV